MRKNKSTFRCLDCKEIFEGTKKIKWCPECQGINIREIIV